MGSSAIQQQKGKQSEQAPKPQDAISDTLTSKIQRDTPD